VRKLPIIFVLIILLSVQTMAQSVKWYEDFELAMKEAKDSVKTILLDFSGSDWCGWCIKLEKEVFDKKAFQDYAKEHLVLMLADFPMKKPQSEEIRNQNVELYKKYKVMGFPTIYLLNPAGGIIGKTGYKAGGPEIYVKHLKEMIAKYKEKSKAPKKEKK
jgi:protein disulfide-isomerase